MSVMKTTTAIAMNRLAPFVLLAVAAFVVRGAHAAAPGITSTTGSASQAVFNLVAQAAHISQPDGATVYSWGYGCAAGSTPNFVPAAIAGAHCDTMQVPGPTLIVTQGQTVTVTLTNGLPKSAGATSILFPDFQVCAATPNPDGSCPSALSGAPGLLTREAVNGGTVTYTFKATNAGTHVYYSGTQSDLQVELGLYGAIIVLPASTAANVGSCTTLGAEYTRPASSGSGRPVAESEFRLAKAAYDHAATCYDREYLFQFSEMDPAIHRQAEEQVLADKELCGRSDGCLAVETEPYHPAYYMINGRSMPDDMDSNYAVQYPHQPYNGNPHMHPGELVLLRVIGTGRWQHPFHEHGNHVRVLARDGNLILSQTDPTKLAGPLLFTTTTTPGQAMDGIFYWSGKGLNWDVYAHKLPAGAVSGPTPPGNPHGDPQPCYSDVNGYYTTASNPAAPADAPNYYEWCADHGKALEKNPLGDVPSGGPIALPDPNILANGAWYGGSPYLGPDATLRAAGVTPIPPSGTIANDPGSEAGFAFMWHSHNEREITTNNAFPGGMMMMMLVDPQAYPIDEAK